MFLVWGGDQQRLQLAFDVVAIAVLLGLRAWCYLLSRPLQCLEPLPYTAVLGVERSVFWSHVYFVLARFVSTWPQWPAMKNERLCQSHVLLVYVCIRRWCMHSLYGMFDRETFRSDVLGYQVTRP